MKGAMAAVTIVAVLTLGAVPAIAQDRDAARAACNTFAQVQTETSPSASPRTPPAATPPPGGVQAPAAKAPATSATGANNPDLAGKSPQFRQAFNDCMTKLGS